MKKGKKIALLIGIFLLALGVTVVKFAHHRGESFAVALTNLPQFDSAVKVNYDQKGYTVLSGGEESFSAGELGSLRIVWLSGMVSVERYDGRDVVVREKSAAALTEDQRLRFRLSGGTLSILPCANRVTTLPGKELSVLIPQGLQLESAEADVTSASVTVRGLTLRGGVRVGSLSGSLHIEDCDCGALDLDSASGSQHILRTHVDGDADADALSGSVTIEALHCRTLSVDSSSGSQKIDALRCTALRLSSMSGSQRVSLIECRELETSSSSGSVRIAFTKAPQSVDVETLSGSVELTFPEGTGLDLDYDTASGSLHGKPARGDVPVNVETTSGSLTIRYQ